MKINKNILYTGLSLGLILSLNSQVLANAAPKKAANCCDELGARLKKLEDRAVMSTSNKVTLSGHVNRAAMWMNDGHRKVITHVDPQASNTRFNLTGTGALTDDISASAIFEVGLLSNNTVNPSTGTVDVRLSQTNAQAQSNLTIRLAEIAFKSKSMGELYMGRGYMAQSGAGSAFCDFSGTEAENQGVNGPRNFAGGVLFVNKATKAKSAFRIVNIFDGMDLVRRDRVRYDTPSIAGFSVNISHAQQGAGHIHDVALRYNQTFGKTKVRGMLSHVNQRETANQHHKLDHLTVGALFPVSMTNKDNTGLNILLSVSKKKANNTNAKGKFHFGKIGLIENFVSFGNTAFAFDYGKFDNITVATANKPVGTSWSLAVNQSLNKVASEVYVSYRNYKLKVKGSANRYDNVNAVMMGARVKI